MLDYFRLELLHSNLDRLTVWRRAGDITAQLHDRVSAFTCDMVNGGIMSIRYLYLSEPQAKNFPDVETS